MRIVPLGAWRNGFDLVAEADRYVGGFRGSVWREGGEIVAGTERYGFVREGRRGFRLAGPHGDVAGAFRPSVWGGPWTLTVGTAGYELRRGGVFTRTWRLNRDGRQVGEVAGRLLRGGGTADLPADLPPAAQVFVVAIVLTLWRRDDAAGGASATATTSG
jgi:hypothetical protein